MAGARNYQGKESEQSKQRRGRKADVLAGEGSVAGKLKEGRKYKKSRLDEINRQMGIDPTRQREGVQRGRSNMETEVDAEGNQDTLKDGY